MFLNIFLEVIFVTILVGGSRYGYNKGLFKMAAVPLRMLLCIALSFVFSRVVGSNFIAPIILSRTEGSIVGLAYPAINALSTVIAFAVLFILLRILISFIIWLVSSILDDGVLGKINRALGFLLAGVIALLSASCVASFAEYVFMQEAFLDSELLEDFTGGPLYRIFILVSPVKLFLVQ